LRGKVGVVIFGVAAENVPVLQGKRFIALVGAFDIFLEVLNSVDAGDNGRDARLLQHLLYE
jgi:hypothetical protein